MSNNSNNSGRAYEYAYLVNLYRQISKYRPATVDYNSASDAAERAWETLDETQKQTYETSAQAGIATILELEPLILDASDDEIVLKLQTDSKGVAGDVRDVVITRKDINWEIGLSIKHNHLAVKHSRLSKALDFGKQWYGIECSEQYWAETKPIFSYLEAEQAKGSLWSDLTDKEDTVYIPLLNAFKHEIEKQNVSHGTELPRLLVEYLIGEFDFYKVIGRDAHKVTQVQGFNLRGTLNKASTTDKGGHIIPITKLPTRIVSLEFKPNNKNTLELYLDKGWQFSFRIHNASSKVEASLKFDIQTVGMPVSITSTFRRWD